MGAFANVYDVLVILKDHGADVDISKKWVTFEYENGFPQSLTITLNSKRGRFLTVAPIIKKWDRIFLRITDVDGNTEEDVFHVRTIKKKQLSGKGLAVTLICPHQSSNLWKRTVSFTRTNIKLSNKEALNDAVAILNANKGTDDPTVEIPATFDVVTKEGNFFDPDTANLQTFESLKYEAVVDQLKDKELQPIEGGGSFEPMYVRFRSKYDHATGNFLDTVFLQAFPQGFHDNGGFNSTPTITLTQTTVESGVRPTVLGLTSNEEPEIGTNIIAVGDKIAGTYLPDFSMYKGAQDVFNNAKDWVTATSYRIGHLVNSVGNRYESNTDHTSSGGNEPPSSDWTLRTFVKPSDWVTSTSYSLHDLVVHSRVAYKATQAHTSSSGNEPPTSTHWVRVNFVPSVDYSPMTKNRAQYWINAIAGSIHAATNNQRAMVIDGNCIIKNELHPRLPVDFVFTDPINIPTELKVDGNVPHAFFMLAVDSTDGTEGGTGPFAGNDVNGIPFAGNVIKFHDEDEDGVGIWKVFAITGNDYEVLDWYEGLSWTKFPCDIAGQGVDGTGACKVILGGAPGTRNTIWKKGSYGLSEIPFGGSFGVWIDNKQFECCHSVKFDSGNGRIDFSTEKLLDDDIDGNSAVFAKFTPSISGVDAFPYFAGMNFHSRHPRTANAIPFTSVVTGEKIKLSVFDLLNMFKTHTGGTTWFGPEVEDYYPIQGWGWEQKFTALSTLFGTFDTVGEYKMGMWLCDERMNVVTIEYTHPRNAETLSMEAALGNRKPYFGVPGFSLFFSAKEPEIIDIFEPHEWLMGGIFTRDSFDDQGRYLGVRSRFNVNNELKISWDAWKMIKPLVVTNLDDTNGLPSRNIETDREKHPAIVSYSQLKNLVLGLEKFKTFEKRTFNIPTKARMDIKWGDPVYYTNTEAVSETTDTKINTLKTVANMITYSGSKVKGRGPAGLLRKVELVTRVWP